MDDDIILMTKKRHPAGLIYIYLSTIVAVGASLTLVIWASNELFDLSSSHKALAILGLFSVAGITVILLFIQTVIYWSNTFTLTDEEVKQTLQHGLFNKKISRLGLANVEDVTVEQKGILASLFNYGTLKVETAGEQSNFNFKFCSHAGKCAKDVMDAREQYLERDDKPTRRSDVLR